MSAKTDLAKGYSDSATGYDATAGPMYLAGLWRLLPYVRPVPVPAVLDVGCGTGINLLEMARVLGPCRLLVGVDLSPGMVEVARLKAAATGIPALFMVADGESLPFPDQTFDFVVCNSVLHWLEDRARAVAEFARVLRPGGQLLLSCAAQPGFGEWTAVVQAALSATAGGWAPPPLPVLPTPPEVAGCLSAAGLVPDYFYHLVQPVRVKDPLSFSRMMACVAPSWVANLDREAKEQTIQASAQLMHALGPAGFPCTWASVEVVATKPDPSGNGAPLAVPRLPPHPAARWLTRRTGVAQI